ncbi:hypothetical protein [Streptomyces sp. NPDC059874]|uniref:hypothetical protein n=1 Tax=Streptomyces sp. NPDC059874 TaxID=3346983 RepID=UPI003659476D
MAELADWTCSFNGLVMGEPDSAISIVAVDGLLTLPDVRSSDLTLVQRHGLYAGDDYMNGRTVTLTLEVYGSSREEFTAALNAVQAAFLPAEAEKPLTFRFPGATADRTAFVMVRPRKRSAPLDLNFANMVCNVMVELYATSPYMEADDLTTLPTLASPFSGTSPKLNFAVDSNVPVLPLITISNVKNVRLTDEITGQYFGVVYTGPTVIIDSVKQEVLSAPGEGMPGAITPGSTWPEWGFGAHRLALYSETTTAPSTALIEFRDRWV